MFHEGPGLPCWKRYNSASPVKRRQNFAGFKCVSDYGTTAQTRISTHQVKWYYPPVNINEIRKIFVSAESAAFKKAG
jgi:hypothetical protein